MQSIRRIDRVDTSLLPDLNWIPMPALLVDRERRFLVGNQLMAEIFRLPAPGADMSMAIRAPELLNAFEKSLESRCRVSFSLSRYRLVERHFSGWIEPLKTTLAAQSDLFIVMVFETTVSVEAERMRSTFIADVSHELRSPLTTMIATLETLQGKAGDDPKIRAKFLDMVSREASRMHSIVNDLLALSATESKRHVVPSGQVDLSELLKNLLETFDQRLLQKSMSMEIDMQDGLPLISGEHEDLQKIFQNLIDNAIKYGSKETAVRVGLSSDAAGKQQTVYVNNMGSPIPEEHLPRLTERFYRVDDSRSRSVGGTGLGLAIVKHIVNRHQGRIHVKSNLEEGTTFFVTLPVEQKL